MCERLAENSDYYDPANKQLVLTPGDSFRLSDIRRISYTFQAGRNTTVDPEYGTDDGGTISYDLSSFAAAAFVTVYFRSVRNDAGQVH